MLIPLSLHWRASVTLMLEVLFILASPLSCSLSPVTVASASFFTSSDTFSSPLLHLFTAGKIQQTRSQQIENYSLLVVPGHDCILYLEVCVSVNVHTFINVCGLIFMLCVPIFLDHGGQVVIKFRDDYIHIFVQIIYSLLLFLKHPLIFCMSRICSTLELWSDLSKAIIYFPNKLLQKERRAALHICSSLRNIYVNLAIRTSSLLGWLNFSSWQHGSVPRLVPACSASDSFGSLCDAPLVGSICLVSSSLIERCCTHALHSYKRTTFNTIKRQC